MKEEYTVKNYVDNFINKYTTAIKTTQDRTPSRDEAFLAALSTLFPEEREIQKNG